MAMTCIHHAIRIPDLLACTAQHNSSTLRKIHNREILPRRHILWDPFDLQVSTMSCTWFRNIDLYLQQFDAAMSRMRVVPNARKASASLTDI